MINYNSAYWFAWVLNLVPHSKKKEHKLKVSENKILK